MARIEDSEGKDIEWPKPPVPGPGATVGDRIEYTLAEGVRRFFGLFDEPLAELGAFVLRVFFKIFEKSAGPYLKPLLDGYLDKADPDDPVVKMMTSLLEPKGIAGGAILAGLGVGAGQAGLMSFLEPFFEKARQMAYKGYPSKVFDPATALAAYWRGEIDIDELNDNLERFGFDITRHSKLEETVRPRLPEGDMGRWYLREEGREEIVKTELGARGYSDDDITRFLDLLEIIPPPTDQIRMAVREAFDPGIVAAYELDADMHKIPFESLKKVGLSKEWAEYYWFAHWVLPSVLQGYEMLHRGEIDEGELDTLMRSLDIMPGWIPKLIAISYRPYTRVDVRRMHKMGVLDEAGVLRSYQDIGFDLEKAGKMTEFTIAFNTEEERDATKTDILVAYEEGIIGRDLAKDLLLTIGYAENFAEAYLSKVDYKLEQKARKEEEADKKEELVKERELTKSDILSSYEDKILTLGEATSTLKEIDYPDSVIAVLIAKVDYKVAQKLIREAIKTVKILYVNQEIDDPDVYERLGGHALPATQIAELLILWKIERDRKTERPTPAQLTTFYFNDILDEAVLREQLGKHKYSEEYIDWFIANANQLILKREEAELERLEKEQQRIREKEFVTDRKIQLADLSVMIQEWKVYIADLKVAALYIIDPEELKTLAQNIVKAKAEIAALQLAKAQVPVVITE